MNLISNNCAGGYFYRDILGSEYLNPFIWTQIAPLDFISLIGKFDQINFSNYELIRLHKRILEKEFNDFGNHPWLKMHPLGLNIDSTFKLWFPHILYKESAIKPEILNTDIYCRRNFELVVNTYLSRLRRMDDDPIFLILDYPWFGWNCDMINKIVDLSEKVKYRIIILTKNPIQYPKSTIVIYDRNLNNHPRLAIKDNGPKILTEICK